MDLFLYVLVGLSVFFFVLVVALVAIFAIRYRHGSKANRQRRYADSFWLEVFWAGVPTLIALALFVWSAAVFFNYWRIPEGAQEVFVTGKQWMWKIQHANGRREINNLHVPINTPIKLTMTSEDVIHSFFIPEFRVKRDVLPGKYTTLWFEPTKTGTYHLFCAEYCGLNHSTMTGSVIVMEQTDYEKWLLEGNVEELAGGASTGEQIFTKMGCLVCHREGASARGPFLAGVFGSEVQLQTGETITADEEYLRESILNPKAKIVFGYAALMPTYKNQLSQDDVFELVNYIKSLEGEG